MPVVARFYGIAIRMYFREHGIPHFHAIYGDHNAVFAIETLARLEGDLPPRAHRLVQEWAAAHQADLREMWRTQTFRALPGLEWMNMQVTYPRVRSVSALTGKRLLVVFATGDSRLYDCRPLLAGGQFARLADEALFQQARADDHGYGVVWDDALDLAESELWINGIPAEPSRR